MFLSPNEVVSLIILHLDVYLKIKVLTRRKVHKHVRKAKYIFEFCVRKKKKKISILTIIKWKTLIEIYRIFFEVSAMPKKST